VTVNAPGNTRPTQNRDNAWNPVRACGTMPEEMASTSPREPLQLPKKPRSPNGVKGASLSARDTGPFRPLRPFGEAERTLFFGREPELATLQELLAGDRTSVMLTGPAGIGKTSLIRAGLLPQLKPRGVSCAYVDSSELNDELPMASTAGALLVLDDLGAALDEGTRTERLIELLKSAANVSGIKILFVIDDEDLYRLDALERRIGQLCTVSSRLRIERFDEGRVAEVIERTVLGGGAYFEAGLSQEMALDLSKEGPVSPSELQVVAGAALGLRLTTAKNYRRAGGADVILWRFFQQGCEAAGGRRAVRALGEIAALGPREAATIEAISRTIGADIATTQRVTGALKDQGLIRPADSGFRLQSEWSRPHVRAFTGEARGRQVAARLLLRSRVQSGGLLSPVQIGEIKRHAGTLSQEESRVVSNSVLVGAVILAVLLAIPLVTVAGIYGRNSRNYYFDTVGQGPGADVVVRLGRPGMTLSGMPHLPSFGSVIADSGFARSSLKEGAAGGTGPLGEDWLRRLVEALRPLPRAIVELSVDGSVRSLEALYQDAALRPAVADAIGAAGRGAPEEIALLKRALTDESEEVRRHVVLAGVALERRTPRSAAPVLAAAFRDPAASVRSLALSEIARLPDAQSAPLYTDALAQTVDANLRKAALEAIGAKVERTPEAAQALGHAMQGPARADAVEILERFIDGTGAVADAAAAAVSEVALDAKAPEDARLDALRLLRRRPTTPPGIQEIAGSPKVMAMAMPLIARAKPEDAAAKVVDAMKGPATLRAGAAAAIGLLPRTADTPKQLKILSYDGSVDVRAEAARALPVLGREALPLLLKEAHTGGAEVERAAVETIGAQAQKLGLYSAVQALEQIAKAPRPSTRKAAVDALGGIAEAKGGAAANALGRLVREKNPQVRADAAGALGDVLARNNKEAIAQLRAVARDPDPVTRRRAAGALGRAKGALQSPAAKALTSFLGDAEPTVRADAAAGLAALGAAAREAPVPALIVALFADKDPVVRSAARRAAQQIGASGGEADKALLALLGASGTSAADRAEIATTAGMIGALQTVRLALGDSEPAVRRAAAEHAGGIGAAGLLVALGDRDPNVRLAAIRGLVGAKAADVLARAARSTDPDVRPAALEALGDVGGPTARATLEAALSDGSERVRTAATRGLARLKPDAIDLLLVAVRDPARSVREEAVAGLALKWASGPASDLAKHLHDETDANQRYAAALALVRQAGEQRGTDALRILDETAQNGAPAARFAARIARAFLGRPEAMVAFLRLLRDGN
jgi:HEAT repeat protein